jgi:hypothetical protein
MKYLVNNSRTNSTSAWTLVAPIAMNKNQRKLFQEGMIRTFRFRAPLNINTWQNLVSIVFFKLVNQLV